ncbi:Dinucleotide-utilizing enzymes involved in molybdopterin and thiamine biosynthesis family 1 [Nitrosococcus oceani ATCC 19707]|uniref:Dinucleotide-utilizing enzymes involved in molybdopterin and thiamine biosynthesis family 1 n=2 Tax=Nitrosococcus oceani TaxID=1229 RepID=Q3J9P0_NITOC|nr:ThiF family adenylyltransferase [Nitrosococcus oceani]ABA58456.1 Dinucleotide-utilizing enzymes involved in molybdopterin and thiamine biosynthesis family 1 [Nitrosococcus oceani ATCC 19707]EDZ67487.1 ThiF family protein [Nitrosococcus oceani AFC27]KFI19058.1 thiamine biosynthesis protein ThiF [Nitrosococcus oceani C-27]GEM18851.1 ThiF family protein [Nitrosococcus oceani]
MHTQDEPLEKNSVESSIQRQGEAFIYQEAFSRNTGWVTEWEQQILRGKKVAIAGMGGVGGVHLLTLARLGIGVFHIADFDDFELPNFNRQVGAMVSTLGRPKVEVLAEIARDINPEVDLNIFNKGINRNNVDAFLEGVDLFVDGFDFFVLDRRAHVFARCAELGIPAITAAPIGIGTAYLVFMPGHMTFEEYFCLEGLPIEQQYVNFLAGLTPKGFHRAYLVDSSRLDLAARRGPSTAMGCHLCAGATGAEALKILLGRGPVRSAPRYHQYDAYRGKWHLGWLPGGNNNPFQLFKRKRGYRMLEQLSQKIPTVASSKAGSEVERILDMARWAPSGDNTQPWRFEIKDSHYVVVHGFDTRDHCVYDLEGHASQISVGTLLESITIAASQYGWRTDIQRDLNTAETHPKFNVHFVPEATLRPDPLWPYIPVRATQRRAMSLRALTVREKSLLEESVKPLFSIHWLEGLENRLKVARLLFMNGKLRLTMPEAYEVHRSVIEWNSKFSKDRIPDQAVGLDPLGVGLMRWALKDWGRVKFLNTYLGGTLLPRIQLDFIPGIACAAHFLIIAPKPPQSMDDYIATGRAWQRFWLTASRLNLRLQPEMTPLIFSAYLREGIQFSKSEYSQRLAAALSSRLEQLLSPDICQRAQVMGRIGAGAVPKARSTRLPLERLMVR